VRSTSPYEDESVFRPRRRHRSLAALFAFSVLVGAAVALVKLRPDAIPPGVSNAIVRARSSEVVQVIERAGSSLLARLPIQHEGHAEPLVPSQVAVATHAAPSAEAPSPARAAETASEPPKSANEPPTVSINALPVAPAPVAPAPRAAPVRVRAAPIAAAPPPVRAPAPVRPAPAPARPGPAEEPPVAVKPKPAPPPPPAAPAPAPGSLDDLIRKAVEADAKKKH
jgi:hypothetical protein